ncbi:MAG: ricin-type beta-trefoil lectin domain protein [Actinoallomurus sp.]
MTDDPTAPPLEVQRGVVLPQVRTAPGVELFSIGGGLNPSTGIAPDAQGGAPADVAAREEAPAAETGAVIPVSHVASGGALELSTPARRSRARLVVLGGVAAAVLVAVPLAVLSQGGHDRSPVRSAAGGHGSNPTNPAVPAPSWPAGSQPPSPLPAGGVNDPSTSPKASPDQTGPGGKRATGGGKAGGGAPNGTSPGGQAPVHTSSTRSIVSNASNRCISVSARKAKDGSPLQIWDCGGASWQKWTVESDGTVRSMGMCMDVAWGSSDNGTAIQLARCHGGSAQHFDLNAAGDLVNLGSYKCVDVQDKDTSNGTRLQLWECGGTPNQKWSAV